MRKLLILTVLFSLSASPTMAQSSKYIIKRSATTSKTTKSGTTQKKRPSYIKKNTMTTSEKNQAGSKVSRFFGRGYCDFDEAGVLQQLKGYEWVITDKHERKTDFFPVEGDYDYDYYPSHPQYRVSNTYLCDNKGIVKAVLLVCCSSFSYYFDVVLNQFENKTGYSLSKLAEDLALKEYKNGAYNVNLASDTIKKTIETYF